MSGKKIKRRPKVAIGWREWLQLPELGIGAIKAKVDTGARTSALHAFKIEVFQQHHKKYVRFWVHPWQKDRKDKVCCIAELKDYRMVSDSGGHREKRYVIETPVKLGDYTWPIEITLTNRDTMLFRMLLGRMAIKQQFVVDANLSFCLGKLEELETQIKSKNDLNFNIKK